MAVVNYWVGRGFPEWATTPRTVASNISVNYSYDTSTTHQQFPFGSELEEGTFGVAVSPTGFSTQTSFILYDEDGIGMVRFISNPNQPVFLQVNTGGTWETENISDVVLQTNTATSGSFTFRWNRNTLSISLRTGEVESRADFIYALPKSPAYIGGATGSQLGAQGFNWAYCILTDRYDTDMTRYRVISCSLSASPVDNEGWEVGNTNYRSMTDVIPANTYTIDSSATLMHTCTPRLPLREDERIVSAEVHAIVTNDSIDAPVSLIVADTTLPQNPPSYPNGMISRISSRLPINGPVSSPLEVGISL